MTRKDYVLIAESLAAARLGIHEDRRSACDYVIRHLAATLGRDNPRFDRERFLKACEVQS